MLMELIFLSGMTNMNSASGPLKAVAKKKWGGKKNLSPYRRTEEDVAGRQKELLTSDLWGASAPLLY